MKKLMTPSQKKVGKVMRQFKRGELNIGQSSKKVKSPKQAIAIALSESGQARKAMAKGGSVNGTSRSEFGNLVDHSQFLNSDGYAQAVDVEMTNAQETQEVYVQGQEKVLPEKRRKAKWY